MKRLNEQGIMRRISVWINVITRGLLSVICYISLFSCADEQENQVVIPPFPEGKAIAISFTFDDGCQSILEKVVPLFDQYGYKATFFVIPGVIDDNEWQTWKRLHEQGYEIGNHTMSHRDLTTVADSTELLEEILGSKKLIEQKLGRRVLSFAHPQHKTSPEIENIVFKGHLFSRLSPTHFCQWRGWTSTTTNKIITHDIGAMIKNGDWYVPAIHGVGDCWEPIDEQLLKDILLYIHERREEIVVETFSNIAMYRTERQHTSFHVTDETNRKLISMRSDLDTAVYNYPLTVILKNHSLPHNFDVRALNGKVLKITRKGRDLMILAKLNTTIEFFW